MSEFSYFWGGTTIGDHGTYTDDQFSILLRALFQGNLTLEGIIKGKLNELAVINSSGVTIRAQSGMGMVDGKLYTNSSNVDFTIAAPATGSNYYTIVLHKDFTAQTVRLVQLGPNAGSYPTVTQSAGVSWEIALAHIQITSSAVITVTDVRDFCHFTGMVSVDMLDDASILASKIAALAITAANIADNTITGAKIAPSTVGYPNMLPLDTPAVNLSGNGIRINLTSAANVGLGDAVFMNSSSKADLGNATVIATAGCIAIALATILTNAAGVYLTHGLVRNDAWAWTPGGLIYLSKVGTTGNTLTQNVSAYGLNNVIQVLGVALSATVIFFSPQLVQIEHA